MRSSSHSIRNSNAPETQKLHKDNMRICVATGSSQPQQQQQKQQQQQPQQQLARVTVIKDFEYLIMKMSEANVFFVAQEVAVWQWRGGAKGRSNDRDGRNLRLDSFGCVGVRMRLLPFLCHSCC